MADEVGCSNPAPEPAKTTGVTFSTKFQGAHRQYITSKIEEIWRCTVSGHYVCILDAEGRHYELQRQGVQRWVDAIQEGQATVRNPPASLMHTGEPSKQAIVGSSSQKPLSGGNTSFRRPMTSSAFGTATASEHARTGVANGLGRFERIFLPIVQSELSKAFQQWKEDLKDWDKLWNNRPNLLRRGRMFISGFGSNNKPSEFQLQAWQFARGLNDQIIAQVESSNETELADRFELEYTAWMIDILNYAINKLSAVASNLHPSPGLLTEIRDFNLLSDNEILVHYTIAFLAFSLICSRSPLWAIETADLKLFRVVLHANTNPNIRFPPKIYDILLNLAAVRQSIKVEGLTTALRRPYEVAVFTLCIFGDMRFFAVLDRQYGVSGLLKALEKAHQAVATEKEKRHPRLWFHMFKTLHAIYDMFLQVSGMELDLDMAIILLKLVVLKPPKLIKQRFRYILVDAIAAVFCSSPTMFQTVFPYQQGSLRLCIDTLRAWADAEADEARKLEVKELWQLLQGTCFLQEQ
ncbi:hypothetical protein M422DRAFT_25689 [Sphaerobolus stellatus SS14]|nr:hypothetical protein M422DRAFT_25689 [Sphaerobolus stellatus SS14]